MALFCPAHFSDTLPSSPWALELAALHLLQKFLKVRVQQC